MSKKVQQYKVDRAKRIQKRVTLISKIIFLPLIAVGLISAGIGLWFAGWGFVVMLVGGLATLGVCLNWYEDNVWIPLRIAKEHGTIDE